MKLANLFGGMSAIVLLTWQGAALAAVVAMVLDVKGQASVTVAGRTSAAQIATSLQEDIEDTGVDLMDFMMPATQWFEADDVLETVFELRVHLEKKSEAIANTLTVLPELKLLELALEQCETNQIAVRFTLEV